MIIKHGAAAAAWLAARHYCDRWRAPSIRNAPWTWSSPIAAGGGIDLLLRAMAESFAAHFKQSFVVPIAPAPAARSAIAYVARSAPDGYTLLFVPALAYSVLPLMQANVGYTEKSFAPICQTFENQMALIVNRSSPFKTVRDIVDAGARTEGLSYAATAVGTITHLAAAALAEMAGQVQPCPVPRRRRFDGPGDRWARRFRQRTLASAAGCRAVGARGRHLCRCAQPLAAGCADHQGQWLRRRTDELWRAVFAAGRAAGRAAKLGTGCKFAVEQPAYVKLAKQFHQGSHYYADAASFQNGSTWTWPTKKNCCGASA